jgi:hypothetical protein
MRNPLGQERGREWISEVERRHAENMLHIDVAIHFRHCAHSIPHTRK